MSETHEDIPGQTFCAGLPFVAVRKLSSAEIKNLRTQWRWKISFGCLLPIVVPIALVSVAVFLGVAVDRNWPQLVGIVIFPLILVPIVGVAVSLLRGCELLGSGSRLRGLTRYGWVRRFESAQPVNGNVAIELFPRQNEVYSVNDERIADVVPVTVNTCAAPPGDVAIWDVPVSWSEPNELFYLQRRRPTHEEMRELQYYGRPRILYWVKLIFTAILFVPLYAFILFSLTLCFFALAQLQFQMQTDPMTPAIQATKLAPLAAFITFLFPAFRQFRGMGLFRRDIELGWIFVVTPRAASEQEADEQDRVPVFEQLPFSGLLWTIEEKPAPWRCLPKWMLNKISAVNK